MTDATSGSAMMAGNPAGDQTAGNTGGDSTASNQQQSNTPASNAPANWYDTIEDTDLKGYLQNKGWKDPSELAVGYRNLEKLVGQDKIPMPKGDDDAEGWARFYDAAGRPKSAEEYKLAVPEGDDGQFAKLAAGKFHELGISQKQAAALSEWWNGQQQGLMEAQQQQLGQRAEQEMAALKSEWGQAFNENVNLGKRAAQTFGLDQAKLESLESAWGTKGMMEFMAKIGRGLTEHNFEGGNTTQGFGMTPEAAKARITALQSDKEFIGKYLNGGAEQAKEMQRLMGIAYPSEG